MVSLTCKDHLNIISLIFRDPIVLNQTEIEIKVHSKLVKMFTLSNAMCITIKSHKTEPLSIVTCANNTFLLNCFKTTKILLVPNSEKNFVFFFERYVESKSKHCMHQRNTYRQSAEEEKAEQK
jgi:hypothetical protein